MYIYHNESDLFKSSNCPLLYIVLCQEILSGTSEVYFIPVREMENISRGITCGDCVTFITEGSMQDDTVARLQSIRV